MKIVIFRGYDWEGMYVDDKLQLSDNSLDVDQVLNVLKKKGDKIESLEYIKEKGDWLEVEGYLPYNLSELKEKNKE
jgi:hypothetical protein